MPFRLAKLFKVSLYLARQKITELARRGRTEGRGPCSRWPPAPTTAQVFLPHFNFRPPRRPPPAQITRDNAAVRTDAAIRETIWKERVLILNPLKTRRSRQLGQKKEDGVFAASAADGDLGSESAARAVHILLLGLHSQPSRYARHREYLL